MSKNKILPLYVLGEVLLGEGLLGIELLPHLNLK
jgi:hypothetical protein